MKIKINTIALYAHNFLSSCLPEEKTGYVHSAYSKAINLCIGGKLFALQPSGSPVSPISLITELSSSDFAGLSVYKNASVSVSSEEIRISGSFLNNGKVSSHGEIAFTFAEAGLFDTLTSGHLQPEYLCAKLYPFITDKKYPGFFGRILALPDFCPTVSDPVSGPFSRPVSASLSTGMRPDDHKNDGADFLLSAAAENILVQSKMFRKSNDYVSAARSLSGLIGLGIGLTPSGDDFLCGVLAAFYLTGQTGHPMYTELSAEIDKNSDRTNDLSAAFLSCAQEGHFSQAVKTLENHFSVKEFLRIGHTSGMDTLCGIYYGAFCLKKEMDALIPCAPPLCE